MTAKLVLLAAGAVLALSFSSAQAGDTQIEAVRKNIGTGTTTPQVAYPPICRWDPLFPKFCKRW